MTIARERHQLKLGPGTGFVKSRLKKLPQKAVTWEVDFPKLPQPMMQEETHYIGLVVSEKSSRVLAELLIQSVPTVNDLAKLLGQAMKESGHRPRHLRCGSPAHWRELFPALEELGIEVEVQRRLLLVKQAYKEYVRRRKEERAATRIKPTEEQATVEKLFPAIAQWIQDGHIEIGDQEGFGFVALALDYGGVVYEDDRPRTLAEAMAALEKGLREWYKEQGIELEGGSS